MQRYSSSTTSASAPQTGSSDLQPLVHNALEVWSGANAWPNYASDATKYFAVEFIRGAMERRIVHVQRCILLFPRLIPITAGFDSRGIVPLVLPFYRALPIYRPSSVYTPFIAYLPNSLAVTPSLCRSFPIRTERARAQI